MTPRRRKLLLCPWLERYLHMAWPVDVAAFELFQTLFMPPKLLEQQNGVAYTQQPEASGPILILLYTLLKLAEDVTGTLLFPPYFASSKNGNCGHN